MNDHAIVDIRSGQERCGESPPRVTSITDRLFC